VFGRVGQDEERARAGQRGGAKRERDHAARPVFPCSTGTSNIILNLVNIGFSLHSGTG
jgi:hypothetical protein